MGGRPRQRKKKSANVAPSFQSNQTDRRQNRAEHKRPLQSPRQSVSVDDIHSIPVKSNKVHEIAHRKTDLKNDLVEYPASCSQPFQPFQASRQIPGSRTHQAQQQYQTQQTQQGHQPDYPQETYREQQSYEDQQSYQVPQQQYQLRPPIPTQQPHQAQQHYPVPKLDQEHQQYLAQQPFQAHQKFQAQQFNRAQEAYQAQLSSPPKQPYQVQQTAQVTQPYSTQHSNQAKQAYQEHHEYQTQQTYHAQQLYETEELCEAEQIYEVEKTYHAQHIYQEQQSFHVQQQYQAQRLHDNQKVYQARQAFDAPAHLYTKLGGDGSDGKNQELSRCAIKFKKPHQLHQPSDTTRLYSKASTDATSGGNERGVSCPDEKKSLPWDWWPGATNTQRYLEKHKNGEGLLFYRLAETPVELRKTKPDETDIWVHVGTVDPPVWGNTAPKDRRMWNDEDEPWDV